MFRFRPIRISNHALIRQLVTVTRKFEWDAMHRISFSEKCRSLHGHRYTGFVTFAIDEIKNPNFDISFVKESVQKWILENWDHTGIFDENDDHPIVAKVIELNASLGRPIYLLKKPPTCENICSELARVAKSLVDSRGVEVVEVTVWETPNIYARWIPDPVKSKS